MGFTGKEKPIRANHKPQSVKPGNCCDNRFSISKSIMESGLRLLKYHLGLDDSTKGPNAASHPNIKLTPSGEECGWCYCTEEHLDEILLENLDYLYNEAVSKLVILGYDKDTALKAVLRNGHYYHGGTDLLTNILQNSLAYLNTDGGGDSTCKGNSDESEPVFSDFRANSKQLQTKAKAHPGSNFSSILDSPPIAERSGDSRNQNNIKPPVEKSGDSQNQNNTKPPVEKSGDSHNQNNQDAVNSVLSKFCDLNFHENLESLTEDQKNEVISAIFHHINDLEKQVQERKDWAHLKAMQAARKLSSDLTELKMLRMEREEAQRLKEGKQALEDITMKRLSEMEIALRKASGQVDRANAAVRRLETENAEIKAERDASKLSASESVSACLQVAKREKKCLKKLLAWEKQKAKLQEEISCEKNKTPEMQKMLVWIKQCQKEAEIKGREELRAKEEALTLCKEEKRLKEEVEANNKRKLEALRLKMDIDFQRHKDDFLRLEQELSRLKASDQPAKLHHHQSNTSPAGQSEDAKPQRETIAKLLQELDKLEEISKKEDNFDGECIICRKDEVAVVFLPCAHQLMCGKCSNEYGRSGNAICPCCQVSVEQMIRVFGPTC